MWQELTVSVGEDHWRKPYQVVVKRTGIGLNITPDETTTISTIQVLFPQHTIRESNITVPQELEVFTTEEL